MFNHNEDMRESLVKRFDDYCRQNEQFILHDINREQVFLSVVLGYLMQSIEILVICLGYKLIPYIRFGPAFSFLSMVSSSFEASPQVDEMMFKSGMAFILHNCFNKKPFSKLDISKYICIIDSNRVNDPVNILKEKKISNETATFRIIKEIVDEYQESLFATLEDNKT